MGSDNRCLGWQWRAFGYGSMLVKVRLAEKEHGLARVPDGTASKALAIKKGEVYLSLDPGTMPYFSAARLASVATGPESYT